MSILKDQITFGKYRLMQLRARGQSTKPVQIYEQELAHMKDLVMMLRKDVQTAMDQRDQYYIALRSQEATKQAMVQKHIAV